MVEKKVTAEEKNIDQSVNVSRNAQDYLDPSVNVSEPELPIGGEKEALPDAPTPEQIAEAAEAKRLMYQKEADQAQGITRSATDKGQEAHLSPEAKAALEKSQGKKS